MRRSNMLAVVAIVLLAPSLVFAASAHNFVAGKAFSKEVGTITVPLNITNEANLAAIDIPLHFSEGVTLKAVTFENTRTEYFDLKIANINNEDNTVVIGLLPQMSSTYKPTLAAGTGPVANLVFEIDNAAVEEITLEAIQLENPGHFLCFVYQDNIDGVTQTRVERPEFESVTVALSGVAPDSPDMPTRFSLGQNYPNPYNPTTTINFDVPKASHVTLSVFNVLGQEVANLVDMEMEAGSHQVEFDGSGIASGVYFYRIAAENFSQTRKMVLVK